MGTYIEANCRELLRQAITDMDIDDLALTASFILTDDAPVYVVSDEGDVTSIACRDGRSVR